FEALAKENVEAERERLGSHVAELRAYWQSKRQVVNAAPKVGRNEPCPCGSGKKHKKCCLAKQGTA
ncbi:MAG TPA: SEC-C metal-binding domain-containing protein, partial [Labilithrix sp.]|nr:SEC-C metal-binding domain-containing protein [Labilithrix sp.]